AGQLAYCKAHLPVWTAHAEAIGSSPELVAELADLTAEAEAAVFEQQCIEQQMKAATLRARMALKRMHRKASLIIRQVRVAAAPAGNEHIYVLAHVPPMKQKSRLGPPGLPMDLRF